MAENETFDWVRFLKKYGIVVILLLLVALISVLRPNFLSQTNIFNVLTQSSIYGIMALGLTLIIISKGIDLSAGSVLALAGVVSASLAQTGGAMGKYYPNLPEMPIVVPILAAVLVGTACGFINGALIAKTGIPAFIATLGMFTIARGLALVYTGGRPVSSLTESFTFFGSKWHEIPMPVVVWLMMAVITWVLLGYTRFGKSIYAIGGNIKAAEVSGLPVHRNLILIYSFAGFLYGIASIVFSGRVQSMHPGAAVGYELTAIAATTIGGTSHSGGIGTIWGAIVGALILGVLRNGLTLMGVHPYWQQVVEGVIIIVAVVIDMRTNVGKK